MRVIIGILGTITLGVALGSADPKPADPKPAPPKPPVAAKPQPCPSGLAAKLVGQYQPNGVAAKDIKISACVWGKFAGPGWIAFHYVPAPAQSEAGAQGGIVFVGQDGKLAAAHFGAGQEHVSARAIDLDGDGTDELLATVTWSSDMAPARGERLSVHRIKGSQVEDLLWVDMSLEELDRMTCVGKLAVEPTKSGAQLVVTSTVKGRTEDTDRCLAKGKHVYRMNEAKSALVEVK